VIEGNSDEAPKDLVGTVLRGTYRLERRFAAGGMAQIFEARHLRTGGRVAVKVLHPNFAHNPDIIRRFRKEAEMIASLSDPSIVKVDDLDGGEDTGIPFIVMELLEGESLDKRLDRLGRLPLPELLDLMDQVGGALQKAHEHQIVHRDIKPENIFLVRRSLMGGYLAKVLDFGISKLKFEHSHATQAGTILGTPTYMAPEAARGDNSSVDERADIWALGIICYRALSGRLPFEGDSPLSVLYKVVSEEPPYLRTLAPDVPPHVLAAVHRALNKNPKDRFGSVKDFVDALHGRWAQDAPQADSPAGATHTLALGPERAIPSTMVEPPGSDSLAATSRPVVASPNALTLADPIPRATPDARTLSERNPARQLLWRVGAFAGVSLLVTSGVLLAGRSCQKEPARAQVSSEHGHSNDLALRLSIPDLAVVDAAPPHDLIPAPPDSATPAHLSPPARSLMNKNGTIKRGDTVIRSRAAVTKPTAVPSPTEMSPQKPKYEGPDFNP
jgi:serine/threonine protein kinase